MNRPTIHTVELYPGAPEQHEVVLLRDYEALHRKLDNTQQAVPDGFVLMPKKLTAENGAKALLIGEFNIPHVEGCHGCDCTGGDEEEPCEFCDGTGQVNVSVAIDWPTIKAIYAKAVEVLAAAPTQPASEQAEQPIKWGSAGTVGNLIAQLRTIDPAMPVFASLRVNNGIRDGVMLKGLVISYEHGDWRFIVKDGPEKCVVIWTQPDDRQADPDAEWVEKAMEQAQVFASAWSLVGGQFDTGDGLEHAEEEKQRLRELLEAGQ